MPDPQVTVVLKGSQAEFRSHGRESDSFAEYLTKLFDQANNPEATKRALMAKAAVGDTVLQLRKEQEDRLTVLKDIQAREESKSQDTALTWELRDLANRRAFVAREEYRKLASELGR